MWVRYTVKNVGPPHLGFPFPVGSPPSCRSLQGYSYLTSLSLVGPPHSELHYSPSHVGPPHRQKCRFVTFRISLSFPQSVTIAFRAYRILSTVEVDIPVDRSFQSYQNPTTLRAAFLYLPELPNTWTKTLQNLCCQIEVSFIVDSFLIGKPWNFQQIHVISLELSNYTVMLISPLP